MDIAIAASLGVLFAVFTLSAVAVLVACRRRLCKRHDLISEEVAIYSDDRGLFTTIGDHDTRDDGDLILDDIARNETWVKDAMGLTPQCLAVMRTCHSLADRLLAVAVADVPRAENGESIASVARQLSQHVEDVASAMYPPLDPRLVEARCTALMLCMTHLVLMVKRACRLPPDTELAVGRELRELENHLVALRERSRHHPQPATSAQDSLQGRAAGARQDLPSSAATAASSACWTTSASCATASAQARPLSRF